MVAAVDKIKAPCAPRVLARVLFGKQKARIVPVRRCAGGRGVYIHAVLHRADMPVSFLYPAAVKAVHQKAAIGHIKAHAHDAPERDIAGAVIFNNAAARYYIRLRKHRVIKRQCRVPVALAQAYDKRLRRFFIVVSRRQALHGDAAGNDLVAFIQKVRGEAAVGHFGLNRRLTIVSPADARPLKAEIIKAVVIVGRVVHYAAAELDIVL